MNWTNKRLRKLNPKELSNLAGNSAERGNAALAQQCRMMLRDLERRKHAEKQREAWPTVNRLLEACSAGNLVADHAAFETWPTKKLRAALAYVNGRCAGAFLPGQQHVTRLLKSALRQRKDQCRGGGPFLQGGRADGNKPNRWER